MADLPSVEQAGGAAVWFTSQAGVTALVLAVICIVQFVALWWRDKRHEAERVALIAGHAALVKALDAGSKITIEALIGKWIEQATEWGKRIDGFRGDIKDAFGENNDIADKVVGALNELKIEIARMSGRGERGR